MTTLQPPPFSVAVDVDATEAVVRVAGDLDHETCDELTAAVDSVLGTPPCVPAQLASLRLDFTDLHGIDSMGLSALLMIRRRTDAARTRLHLDELPAVLERLLDVTGTRGHLTAPPGERGQGFGEVAGRPAT
ncbi:STAS domain-containing protein [Streptomyces sp. NPDC086783]|uniref:STAS domain-containing protein n=1 Tax=Streptomyces sp. NPDC086783 TaxID=3365758 RepID=UPI00380A3E41